MIAGLSVDLVLGLLFGGIGFVLLLSMPTNYYLVNPAFLKQLERGFLSRGLRTARKALMTANEKEFMGRLEKALPEYHIMAQVSMGALMDVAPGSTARPDKARWSFASKIVDYVICSRDRKEVIALVELDDRTHDNKRGKDAYRDSLTAQAGYPTIRWDSRKKPSIPQIRQTVLALA